MKVYKAVINKDLAIEVRVLIVAGAQTGDISILSFDLCIFL